ncbi:penicillin acylase family protein [Salinisphaera sp. P385]|uniref:Penicillin acylase family protein n=1 Tax=Spectribacter acetivorans TaxID=3075603 RepID=A0ABU3B6X6_9GAMM|nr:penicillin acylase family protein [Salinisphaera sp. P385]MDT0618203.1 penicillin acylase family protein [Salinisphaera sp. P385]
MRARLISLPFLLLALTACGGGSGGGGFNLGGDGDDGGDNPGPVLPGVPQINAPPVGDPYADNGTVLNILPPGQDDTGGLENASVPGPLPVNQLGPVVNQVSNATGLTPALAAEAHFMDQLGTYDALAHSPPGLTNADLVPTYFKTAELRGPDDGPWESEQTVSGAGYEVAIKRGADKGVPHIFGDTRADALFGTGYVTAADRLFLLDVLRRAGRGELSKFLGPADFSFDRDIAFAAPYREADRTRQITETAAKFGAAGEQVLADVQAFVDGLNTYVAEVRTSAQLQAAGTSKLPIEYLALGVELQDFTREDVHAIATLIQSIFAGGGGGEADNVRLLHALADQTADAATACRLWRDIRHALDPASSVTTTESFATQSPADYDDDICPLQGDFAATYPGNAFFDAGSYQPHDFFTTEPCGLQQQTACPNPVVTGNLPQLPGTGEVTNVLDELIGGIFDILADRESAVQPPLRQAHRGPLSAGELQQVRQRVAGLASALSDMADGLPRQISNALLVGGEHTASGNPIAVFGPQTSYFTPQLLVEMAVHGGDLHTRGMTFAGLPYVVIGRGVDFAWSATSGSSDLTDVRAVRLCAAETGAPRSGYLVNGQCKAFDRFTESWPARWNLAVPMDDPASVGQNVAVTRDIIRTDEYGPVFAFATVNGDPVALTRQRSTYRAELDTVVPFFLATRNDVFDADSFLRVFNTTTGSFNWFFADRDDIAFIHSGLYPRRAEGVHPDLPVWGDGTRDWQGFLDLAEHPQAINPSRGFLASWNNRPARDWWAADANASYGPNHRNDSLDRRLTDLVDQGNVTRANVVEAMGDAATVDLRGREMLPSALDVLEQGTLTADEQTAVDLMRDWIAGGALRRDRDNNGEYDDAAAVALMDAWYNPMIEQALPQLTALENVNGGNRMIMGRDNPPGPMGSAYQSGYFQYLERVFDMALNADPRPYRELECGGPDGNCRAALRTSLATALDSLGGIGNRANWDADEAGDRIVHRPLGLSAVPAIDWQNRPTFQQVVEFERRR